MTTDTLDLALGTRVARRLEQIRRERPLIHHLTNLVVMADTADATLALGALPVMAVAVEEAAEMASGARALVLNLGTPTVERYAAMLAAGQVANARGIPIVLDPVGVGATSFRLDNARRLLAALRVTIIRGNAAELATLAGIAGELRGVESLGAGASPIEIAGQVARQAATTAVVTGARDVVVAPGPGGERLGIVENGDPMLGRIVGSGCIATALIAAFAAVEPDPLVAAVGGLVCVGVAGEVAAARASGPGSFRPALLDALAALDRPTLEERTRVRSEE